MWARGLKDEWRIIVAVGKLEGIKVGDTVVRHVGDSKGGLQPWMKMRVIKIENNIVTCLPINGPAWEIQECEAWTFDVVTGAEIDDDLRWGPRWGRTGSCIRLRAEEHN